MRKKYYALLILLIAWIIFIFCRSLKPVDASRIESRWVMELLNRLLPFDLTEHFVRKAAHFTEFAILGALVDGVVWRQQQRLLVKMLLCLSIGIFVALADETIQLFVEGRGSQVSDVWLDFSGAVTGAVVVTLVRWMILRISKPKENDQEV